MTSVHAAQALSLLSHPLCGLLLPLCGLLHLLDMHSRHYADYYWCCVGFCITCVGFCNLDTCRIGAMWAASSSTWAIVASMWAVTSEDRERKKEKKEGNEGIEICDFYRTFANVPRACPSLTMRAHVGLRIYPRRSRPATITGNEGRE